MATTVYDIARAAGVGRTTVLRALWDRADISPETKAKIKKIAADMKYRPNHIARSLVMGQSNLVGLVAAPSTFPTAFGTMEIIESELRNAGYSMILSGSGGYPGGERRALEQFLANRVAGVIAVPASSGVEPEAYQEMLDAGVKMAIVDRRVEGLPVPQIVGDDYRAAYVATEHLISLGHKRIAYLAIPQTCCSGRERLRGFHDALCEAGLPIASCPVVETPFDDQHGMGAMVELLKQKERPTAVLTRHDVVAAGALRAIQAAGLSVPEDISLVGNGNIWCGDILATPLTTVRHPMEQMAMKAVDKLLAMLAGEHVKPSIEMLPVELIIRSSTAPPRSR